MPLCSNGSFDDRNRIPRGFRRRVLWLSLMASRAVMSSSGTGPLQSTVAAVAPFPSAGARSFRRRFLQEDDRVSRVRIAEAKDQSLDPVHADESGRTEMGGQVRKLESVMGLDCA